MTAVPAATPFTTPVEAFTVAIPVALLDQLPPDTVEVNVVVPPTQIPCVPLRVPADAGAVTVTDLVAVAFAQPPVPFLVYVMIAVPAVTPLTTPVEAFTVAIPVALLDQLPPDTVEVNVVVPPTQIPCVPLRVPADAGAVTVTDLVAVAFAQPPVPFLVYVMIAVPAVTPLTTPVEAFTVAIPVALLDQLPPDTVEVNVVVPPIQIPCVPLMVPADAGLVTVMVPLAVPVPPVHPLRVTV